MCQTTIHPKDCCRMPPLVDESLLLACKQVHGGEELTRDHTRERGTCFMECAMNRTGTLIDGVLDQAKILRFIAERVGNLTLRQALSAACMKCFQSAHRFENEAPNHSAKHCSSTAARFIGCVNLENFKMCLDEYWNNSQDCNLLRKYIEGCSIPS
ncbi:uncharacterized protein LOC129767816 isoform X2 [Toxorhynchites rutilus septentrionalis]|uniref:uncharacterized protein LOC129767816 isoform X2 n=1 Tax=Toxorhynchites rutilus septentrionalis TaxID=329112 RepID=UPI002479CA47|nr:uncharacterized protein LOC129767816 isoform X2 [Toxorhynchites rutilus septentrionalis]